MWKKSPSADLRMLPKLDFGIPKRARVCVAMSGGVDSAIAAALAQRAGYEVVGLTMQLYEATGPRMAGSKTCCAGQDVYDARQIAVRLGITHYVLNYEARFRSQVMQPFADSYVAGETPVPCINCNQSVKFLDLLTLSKQLKAHALITGHYIRAIAPHDKGDEVWQLHRPKDKERDQSYFLFATTHAQIKYLRFPLGSFTKQDIRSMAKQIGLSVANKSDSQDICFVPQGRYADVVERLRPDANQPGDIVDTNGNVLGRHAGIIHYTVGQRRGLGIAGAEPLYVLALHVETRQVVVGPRAALGRRVLHLRNINWLGRAQDRVMRLRFRMRSSGEICLGQLTRHYDKDKPTGEGEVILDVPELGIAHGQACVFYAPEDDDTRLYGGGWMTSGPTDTELGVSTDRKLRTLEARPPRLIINR